MTRHQSGNLALSLSRQAQQGNGSTLIFCEGLLPNRRSSGYGMDPMEVVVMRTSWNGYPELYVMLNPHHTEMHRHLKIDGHPAVYVTVRTGSVRETELLVSIPEQDFMCEVGGSAEDTNFAALDREMHSIVASFHIEKVAPPPGGRQ